MTKQEENEVAITHDGWVKVNIKTEDFDFVPESMFPLDPAIYKLIVARLGPPPPPSDPSTWPRTMLSPCAKVCRAVPVC